jgi:WhiB family redox-sensing transcriptional regulator
MTWRLEANCSGMDPDLFFAERGDCMVQVKAAREVCAGCTVREACLEEALETGVRFGIWGGKTAQERRKLRRARRAA